MIQTQFALDATLSNTPDRYSSEDINPARRYLTVDPESAGDIAIGPTLSCSGEPIAGSQYPASEIGLVLWFIDAVRRTGR